MINMIMFYKDFLSSKLFCTLYVTLMKMCLFYHLI